MSVTDSKLLKRQRELKILEKKEQKLIGSLESLFKSLKKELGQAGLSDLEATEAAEKMIKMTAKKIAKAEKQFADIMGQVDSMVEGWED